MEKERLGFVGLGTIGLPMVRNLHKAGFPIAVWNRSPKRLQALAGSGIECAASLAELAERCPLICFCLSDDQALRSCVSELSPFLRKGQGLVDFSTVAPSTAIEIAKNVASSGVSFADAPVTGGDIGAINGTLTIMVGTDAEFFERIKPVLSAVGKKIVLVGGVGNGQKIKAINQVAVAISIIAMSEAMVMAKTLELDVPLVLDVLGSGAAGSWSIANYAPRILRGDLRPGFSAGHMLKDLRIVEDLLRERGVELPGTELARRLYERLCGPVAADLAAKEDAGKVELGNHALIACYPEWVGCPNS